MDVIGIVHRGSHHVGIAVHVVIQLLGASRKGKDLAAFIQRLVPSGDLAGGGHVHEGVHIHLGMDRQIL